MVKSNSKPALEGDEKFMEKFSPGSTRYLKLWKKTHDFDGKLTKSSCNNLVDKLKIEVASAYEKEKPLKQLQLLEAMKWREQAEKRKRNIQKKQNRKQEKAALQAAILVKPDEETVGPSVGVRQMYERQRQTQERQLGEEEKRLRLSAVASSSSSLLAKTSYPDLGPLKDQYRIKDINYECKGCDPNRDSPTIEGDGIYPMIEVANPHFGAPGQNEGRTMKVYRPWTDADCTEACKTLWAPKVDPEGWVERHKQLVDSFGLNGVKAGYTGRNAQGQILPSEDQALQAQLQLVHNSVKETWKMTPDYFLCDSGADRTVLRDRIPGVGPSKDKIMVRSANGQLSVSYFSKPLTVEDSNTGKQENAQVVSCPECPVNLLDLMTKLKISIVPTSRGMVARNIESVEDTFVAEGLEVHYDWSLDLPNPDPTETGKHLLSIDMEGLESFVQPDTPDSDRYHVTLRYKKTPGPDVEYDKRINKLGPQKVTLSHLYTDRRGFAGCSAKLTHQAYKQFAVWDSVPHMSLMKPEKADCKDVGQFVKRARPITAWQQLPDGWSVDVERWSVYRKTPGWVVNTTPRVHLDNAKQASTWYSQQGEQDEDNE
ncbi:hypothetical protein Q5P01_008403 [Channa striata]|uniref:Retropepsins domain-containing protein n=1 Tax=Channa striata TaxID=64152 RepID=A0AA88SWH7_CHASR|nr:hypothetical protein Q5P01_008403 [Channa striata]